MRRRPAHTCTVGRLFPTTKLFGACVLVDLV